MADWDARFMSLALHVASWSKDQSTKVGCVVVGPTREVLAVGYNGFPRGLDDDRDERHERPAKYLWTEHAERNAIFSAARVGVSLSGTTMFLPWFPCPDCARAIVQAGIAALVAVPPDRADPRWGDGFPIAEGILRECGVAIRWYEAPLGGPAA
jgi:dCMP deaminase